MPRLVDRDSPTLPDFSWCQSRQYLVVTCLIVAGVGQQCPCFHAKRVQVCACQARVGGSWNWGSQIYCLPLWVFISLPRLVARWDLVCLAQLPDGTLSGRLPHRVAWHDLVGSSDSSSYSAGHGWFIHLTELLGGSWSTLLQWLFA